MRISFALFLITTSLAGTVETTVLLWESQKGDIVVVTPQGTNSRHSRSDDHFHDADAGTRHLHPCNHLADCEMLMRRRCHNETQVPGTFIRHLHRLHRTFRNWFHKVYKQKYGIPGGGRSNPVMGIEEILEALKMGLELGGPSV